ncbi:Ankyrin repeat domain-containing protein 50 [Pleurostoma richardsiae]|uniref:Ankyrin repeat domain-containing protein 50 n=1 Tax=Pleurostoma richardsiae TaxID=41990 RepID=A0AA38RJC1_9PEZI|nr:Ankyrin repeat domain-containing protein 50 [Pleurostoma richardsiae]
MDGLSAAASIITVIQLISEVAGYIGSATGATKERKCLRQEVQACDDILQQIKDGADDAEEGKAWSKTIKILEEPGAPLGRLSIALQVVRSKLEPKRGGKLLTALRWPFEKQEVDNIISAIEREKALLSLALANDRQNLARDVKKIARENTRLLVELIETVKEASKENRDRFAELRDDLVRVQGSQVTLVREIDRLNVRSDEREADEELNEILSWLTPTDYAPQQSDFLNRQQPGTGQWLLDSTEFKVWVESGKQTLFCPGMPGAGKTILTSIVVEHLYDKFQKKSVRDYNIGIAYVYCNFRRRDEQKVGDLLASLLKQLCQARHTLPDCVKRLFSQHRIRRTRPSLYEVSSTLQSVAGLFSRAFILIDALDECQASDGTLARFLASIFEVQANSGANIFATSRLMPEVMDKFDGIAILEIRASEEDMRRYLDGHMFRLPRFVNENARLQEEIRKTIVRLAQGMFLLAQLHLDSLIGKRSVKTLRASLEKLPAASEAKPYDSAYESVMERIEGQLEEQTQLAKQVLSWITFATRPLTTLELQHALAVEVGKSEIDEENLPDIGEMVSVCAGLVTVDVESGIIRLVHYTTQEYFERTRARWFPDAEAEMTTTCITYLSFSAFASGPCSDLWTYQARLHSNPLYEYAARSWGVHARNAGCE